MFEIAIMAKKDFSGSDVLGSIAHAPFVHGPALS